MKIRVRVKDAEKIVYVYGQAYKTRNDGKLIHEVLFFPVDKPTFIHDRQLSKEQQKYFNQIKRQIVKKIIQEADKFFAGEDPIRSAVSE